MKIIIVTNKLNLNGGGENHDVMIRVRGLKERGHEATVLTIFSNLNNFPEDLPFRIIEEQAPSLRLLSLQAFMVGILKKYGSETDVFYLIGSSALFAGGWYRRFIKGSKPVVGDINGYLDFVQTYKKTPLYPLGHLNQGQSYAQKAKYFFRVMLERSLGVYFINRLDALVFMTKRVVSYHSRAGVKNSKITVIPSFHDINALQNKPLEPNPFIKYPPDTFNIVCSGRLHLDKGVDILIRAFAKCSCPGAILHIIGEGPEKENLKKLAEELNLNDKVVFHPWQKPEGLVKFYQHARLFVYPGRLPEAMVRATTEAMALGLPLVLPDTSVEDWAALGVAKIFKNGDSEALRLKLEEAYRDKEFINQAGIYGKKLAPEFDYRNLTLKLEKALLSVIKN